MNRRRDERTGKASLEYMGYALLFDAPTTYVTRLLEYIFYKDVYFLEEIFSSKKRIVSPRDIT